MEFNWITIAICVVIVFIIYMAYKVVQIMKDIKGIKQNIMSIGYNQQQPICKPVSSQHVAPVAPPKPVQVVQSTLPPPTQPKLAQPKIMNIRPVQQFEEVTDSDDTDNEEELDNGGMESEMFELNDETDFDFKSNKEMIIPLDLNSIIQQVVNNKMTETKIVEVESHLEAQTSEVEPEAKPDLHKKTINELKELAKQYNIKLTDSGKPKNKETLIKELSNV